MEITLLLLPLLGAILCGWGWRLFGDTAATWIATLSSVGAAALAFWTVLTFDGPRVVALGRWIESGSLSTDWSILIDGLSAAMLLVTMTLVALLQVYAIGFMARDEDFPDGEVYRPRFFAFLSLFAFALGVLFTAENLLQLIFGWQAVAFVGFLLTGFYFRKPSANSGAMRAFVTGRVGDSALLVALAALFAVADSAVFSDILDTTTIAALRAEIWTVAGRDITAASAVGGLLALAAAFKAALIFAHISAPRSMDAPAPGAALIVVLGGLLVAVFLVLRLAPIFNAAPLAGLLMVGAGGLTTVFGAGAALAQRELKRVLAFASVSQGGVVFVALGLGAYGAALTQALAAAVTLTLLYLGAGSVIRAMQRDRDMRGYGGLRSRMPVTYAAMVIGALGLAGVGIPATGLGFGGFTSLGAIASAAQDAARVPVLGNGQTLAQAAFWALCISGLLTGLFVGRLILLTFHGRPRGERKTHDQAQEAVATVTVPMGILMAATVAVPVAGAFAAGLMGLSTGGQGPAQGLSVMATLAPLAGLALAWPIFARGSDWPQGAQGLGNFLRQGWGLDALVERVTITPLLWLGERLSRRLDGQVIEAGTTTLARVFARGALPWFARPTQDPDTPAGGVAHYAMVSLSAAAILVIFFAVRSVG